MVCVLCLFGGLEYFLTCSYRGFGGYGRLGHRDNKDVHEPTAVEMFSFEPPPPNPDLPKFLQRQQPKFRGFSIACGGKKIMCVLLIGCN